MPYNIPDSQKSKNTEAILDALGIPYDVDDSEISKNVKAILDAIEAFKLTVNSYPPIGQEVQVGTWVDGKPIYRRVLGPYNLPALTNLGQSYTIGPNPIANVKQTITFKIVTASQEIGFQNLYGLSGANLIYMNLISAGVVAYNNVYLLCEYTKTTD
jgi:hypothetical protein